MSAQILTLILQVSFKKYLKHFRPTSDKSFPKPINWWSKVLEKLMIKRNTQAAFGSILTQEETK